MKSMVPFVEAFPLPASCGIKHTSSLIWCHQRLI